jgi:hypothetical protein
MRGRKVLHVFHGAARAPIMPPACGDHPLTAIHQCKRGGPSQRIAHLHLSVPWLASMACTGCVRCLEHICMWFHDFGKLVCVSLRPCVALVSVTQQLHAGHTCHGRAATALASAQLWSAQVRCWAGGIQACQRKVAANCTKAGPFPYVCCTWPACNKQAGQPCY